MQVIYFIISNFLAVYISSTAADRAMSGRENWRKLLAAVAGFSTIVLIAILVLGTFGYLSAIGITIFLSSITAVLQLSIHLFFKDSFENPRKIILQEKQTHIDKLLWNISIIILSGLLGILLIKSVFLGTNFNQDDLSYHAPIVAHWLIDKKFSILAYNYQVYYPQNAESLSFWFMLPFGNDAFASLSGFYWCVLLISASICIILAQGYDKSTAVITAVLCISSPVIWVALEAFSSVDLAIAALVLTAIALASPSPDMPTIKTDVVDGVYCGLISGFAAGSKVSFLPIPFILFFWLIRRWIKPFTFWMFFKKILAFVVATLLTGSYWYLRNFFLTRNPIFPAEFGSLSGPFHSDQQYQTKLISYIFNDPTNLEHWTHIIQQLISWPFSLFMLALAGYITGLFQYLQIIKIQNKALSLSKLLSSIGIFVLLLFPMMPFSGSTNNPTAPLLVSQRYLILPYLIGLILFTPSFERSHKSLLFWYPVSILSIITSWREDGKAAFIAIVLGSFILLVLNQRKSYRLISRFWKFRVQLCLLILTALGIYEPVKHKLSSATLFSKSQLYTTPLCRAGNILERIPEGSRIGWFGPSPERYYPFFGRRLQFTPVKLNFDGIPSKPLHELWLKDPVHTLWWPSRQKQKLNSNNFINNLTNSGVEYVLVSRSKSRIWPLQQELLISSDNSISVFRDNCSVLWKITSKN